MFGYGSLAATGGPLPTRAVGAHGFVADLVGARRAWGVAMDNRVDLPGYKYYTDTGGRRPSVFVAFLDVELSEDQAATVNGVCLPADDALLAALDARERNYERIDVSHRVAAAGARVWAYRGSEAGRARLRAGLDGGAAVIAGPYLRGVHAGFRALGAREHAVCRGSLEPGPIPVAELVRHDLPG